MKVIAEVLMVAAGAWLLISFFMVLLDIRAIESEQRDALWCLYEYSVKGGEEAGECAQ